jgi:hypothetical protein
VLFGLGSGTQPATRAEIENRLEFISTPDLVLGDQQADISSLYQESKLTFDFKALAKGALKLTSGFSVITISLSPMICPPGVEPRLGVLMGQHHKDPIFSTLR